jgi:hypothetical protein
MELIANWRIRTGGTLYRAGERLTVGAKQARRLLRTGAAREARPEDAELADPGAKTATGTATGDAARAAAIRDAIAQLPPGEAGHWTKAGKPEVAALERITGLTDISAAERDAAWEAHRSAQKDT